MHDPRPWSRPNDASLLALGSPVPVQEHKRWDCTLCNMLKLKQVTSPVSCRILRAPLLRAARASVGCRWLRAGTKALL